MAKFLGIEKSEEEIKAVVETCSFDNMKKADAELKEDFPSKTDNEGKSSIFRKGLVYLLLRLYNKGSIEDDKDEFEVFYAWF